MDRRGTKENVGEIFLLIFRPNDLLFVGIQRLNLRAIDRSRRRFSEDFALDLKWNRFFENVVEVEGILRIGIGGEMNDGRIRRATER